jgi:hypothetical protein
MVPLASIWVCLYTGGEAYKLMFKSILNFIRYHLLLRRRIRGNQCRNQYVQPE